ncbi:protein N-terminal glutamine amidohydrolase-like isoform X2 [Symsagittifera roscoffensis]|uniref:protein N-terminal glutamine amidohydrolase-like isoform X2 n=1 Tax=Symsagittifera roscoffensis TaxID=84072 RepID=UPI00307B6479
MQREDLLYTSHYCEENVWKFCESVRGFLAGQHSPNRLNECWAVFVSNANKTVPIWCQKASAVTTSSLAERIGFKLQGSPTNTGAEKVVFDLDTNLLFPCAFDEYISKSFGSDEKLQKMYHRWFRVVQAEQFLADFASDRSHMKKMKKDGSFEWSAPPPPYAPIKTKKCENNIEKFWSMDETSNSFGTVLSLMDFSKI